MTIPDLANLADLVRRRSGIALTPDKWSLARSRLKPVAALYGFRDVEALLAELPYPPEELAAAITEAMTTSETSFFRNDEAFAFLAERALPALAAARTRSRRIRLWCAAAATGQEAYSLAMLLEDAGLMSGGWRIDLIATDFSEVALGRAREGLYAGHEIARGLPADMRRRFFVPEGDHWRVAGRLRRAVTFRNFNLLDHFGWLGEIDIVLCRNVLFYFEPAMKAEVHAKLAAALAPDGYLFLGESETPSDHFAPLEGARGIFVKTPAARPFLRAAG